jgi:DNA-binding transcriptional ArsR family regulator
MDEILSVSQIAKIIASPSRSAMLMALSDGRALPASELAFRAGISTQTASEHLAMMRERGILSIETCGRHRYYRVVNQEMIGTLEDLLASVSSALEPMMHPDFSRVKPLRDARMCYDHLAGRLGVSLAETFLERDWVSLHDRDFSLTEEGRKKFEKYLRIDWSSIERSRRLFGRRCIDWSERKPHIGGAFGAALAQCLLGRDWVRQNKDSRSIYPTQQGRKMLLEFFDIRC